MAFHLKYQSDTYSKFEYIPKGSPIGISSDIPAVINKIQGNALDFTTKFKSGEITKPILANIAQELESTARYFGAQQGLSGSRLLDEENLFTQIHGYHINFINRARDDYGRFYAGHIEYGHYSKDRKSFVPARPFMRPALYAVSQSSQGYIENILSDVLKGVFLEEGLSGLRFGSFLGDVRYGHPSNYTVNKLLSSKIYESDEGYYKQDDKLFGKHMGGKRPNYVMTGKDFSLLPGFNKQMDKWSLRRYSESTGQKSLRQSHGYEEETKRNPITRKTNWDALADVYANPLRVSQAQAHANAYPVKKYSYSKERRYRGVRPEFWRGGQTDIQERLDEIHLMEGGRIFFTNDRTQAKLLSDSEKIKRASIKPTVQYAKPISPKTMRDTGVSGTVSRRTSHRTDIVSTYRKKRNDIKNIFVADKVSQTKGYQKQQQFKSAIKWWNRKAMSRGSYGYLNEKAKRAKERKGSHPGTTPHTINGKRVEGEYDIRVYYPNGSVREEIATSEEIGTKYYGYDKKLNAYKQKGFKYT